MSCSTKNKRKLTRKQTNLVEGIDQGKSGAQAARDAGYSLDTAKQAAYQTMKAIGDRAREVLDAKGLTLEQIIDNYLHPLLEANETKFFPY